MLVFTEHIVPLLTRSGCNAGACHGAAAGRGGLHLSLFGSNPTEDYAAIVYQLEGRRINRIATPKSLLLRKPLGELQHGGDQVFDARSREISHAQSLAGPRCETGYSHQTQRFCIEFDC